MNAYCLGRRIQNATDFSSPKYLLLAVALAAQCLALAGCERNQPPVGPSEVHPAPGADLAAPFGGVIAGDRAGELIEHPYFSGLAFVVDQDFKTCYRKSLDQPIIHAAGGFEASSDSAFVRINRAGGQTVVAVCDGLVTAATTLPALPERAARWVAEKVGDVGTAVIHTDAGSAAHRTEVALAAQIHQQIEDQMRFHGAEILPADARSAAIRSGAIELRAGVLHRVSRDGLESAIPLGSDVVRLLAVMEAEGHDTLLVGVQADALFQGGAPVMSLRVLRMYDDRTEVAANGGWVAYSNAPITVVLTEQGIAKVTAPTPEGLMRLSFDAGWMA